MNNDLIIKTDKENVYSVRSIDSAIIKKLSPKKGELLANTGTNNTILEKLLTGSLTATKFTDVDDVISHNSEDGGVSVDQRLNQTQEIVVLDDSPEETVKKAGPRRSTRRESVYSNRICIHESGNAEESEESVRKPGPRRSIRSASVYPNRKCIDESDTTKKFEESVRRPGPRSSKRRESVYSNGICVDESSTTKEIGDSFRKPGPRSSIRRVYSNRMCINKSNNTEESVKKSVPSHSIPQHSINSSSDDRKATLESVQLPAPAPHPPIRRKSVCASRLYAKESDNRVTKDDLEVGKHESNKIKAQNTFISYFKNPKKEISPNADMKKAKINSTGKYNGGKFKVKISPTSSKHRKHENIMEQANISSGKDTFKDKVEKYFQQLEELRNKTMLNSSPILDTEQPLRLVFKVEGFLSKNTDATSKKRKRQSETQNQNKKAKNDKLDSKPCPKSKKLFYV